MTKKEFLNELKNKLNLDSKEKEEIIKEYDALIEEKKKNHLSEKKAVATFGNVDELVKELEKTRKKHNDVISKLSKNIIDTMEKIYIVFQNKTPLELFKMALEILFIFFIIGLCHIPLTLLEKLGKVIFYFLSKPLNKIFYFIWQIALETTYLVLSIISFIRIFKSRYLNTKNINNSQVAIPSNLVNILVVFFKFLAIIILFIISAYLIIMAIILALCIYLLINKVTYFGFYIAMFSLFILGTLFFRLLYNFVIDHPQKNNKTLGILIATFILLGLGCFLATTEVAQTTFLNEAPLNVNMETLKEEIPFTNNLTLVGNISNFIVDDNMKNIEISYNYFPTGIKLKTNFIKKDNEVYLNWQFNKFKISKDLIDQILNDLQAKKIYNYYLEPQINVKSSAKIINLLKKNRQNYYHNIKEYSKCNFIRTYKIIDIINNNDQTFLTITSPLDDDVITVKIKKELIEDITINNYYEFTFSTYQSYIDTDIDEIFNDADVIKITKTDKKIAEQTQDASCSVFY